MAYVVTDACTDCRFTKCIEVCPVECFHVDERMVYIDPAACIDCAGCVTECPVGAIDDEFNLSGDKQVWIGINRERSAMLPKLSSPLPPLPTADARRAEMGK